MTDENTDHSPAQEAPAAPTASRRRGGCLKALLSAALVACALALVALAAGWFLLVRPDHSISAGEPVEVAIAKGTSTAGIAEQLSQEGVIGNALMFRVLARTGDRDAALKAGTYALETGMEYDAVLARLEKGPEIVIFDVPIPEGFTTRQVATRFAKRAGVDEDELLALMTSGAPRFADEYPFLAGAYRDSLEGYLFPATYRVKEGASAETVVRMMLDTFAKKTASLDMSYAESKNLTFSDVIVIASAIEREAQLADDRPRVASVIYNRLKAGMRLQLCATVLYELPGKTSVTLEDLKIESPYNTYIHAGLPPGPISNPGIASIEAAAHPPKTKYLYYVLTGKDGSHTFTETYDEFLRAKKVSQQVFGD